MDCMVPSFHLWRMVVEFWYLRMALERLVLDSQNLIQSELSFASITDTSLQNLIVMGHMIGLQRYLSWDS